MWGHLFFIQSHQIYLFYSLVLFWNKHTCWHMFLPHSLLPPIDKFRLRRQKSRGKYRNWGKNICLTIHATECFLGICCVYKMVSYPHIRNICLSENQIWFYKEIAETKILFSQVIPDLFKKKNQASFKNWEHQAFNHSWKLALRPQFLAKVVEALFIRKKNLSATKSYRH